MARAGHKLYFIFVAKNKILHILLYFQHAVGSVWWLGQRLLGQPIGHLAKHLSATDNGACILFTFAKKKKKREKKKLILLASLLGRMINGPLDTVRESGEATDPSYGLKTIIVFNKKCMLIITVPGGIKGRDWRVIKIDMRKS